MKRIKELQPPFFEIGPKNYLYGDDILELALAADRISEETGIDVIFTCPYVEIRRVADNVKNIHISAAHMDPLVPGRGIADILPEAIKAAGAEYVTLNHCEKSLSFREMEKTVGRAREVGLKVIICASSIAEAKAVSLLGPDIVIAEPDELIGTGNCGDVSYVHEAVKAVKEVNNNIYVLVGAGIKNGEDVYNVIFAGCDASGTSSGIINAKDRPAMIREMLTAAKRAWVDGYEEGKRENVYLQWKIRGAIRQKADF